MNTIYLSLGSNVGDRASNMHCALRLLEREFVLIETSFLYETEPMGYVDQDYFFNAVVKMHTTKTVEQVLWVNERIMAEMGRVRRIHQGPRIIDIDILLYYNAEGVSVVCSTNQLTVPHVHMHKRVFVVEPLCDIDPQLVCDAASMRYVELLEVLGGRQLQKVTPMGSRVIRWGERPLVMGIINTSIDSFSGDGIESGSPAQEFRISELFDSGADIIDIGGQSTKPGHTLVSPEKEIAQLVSPICSIVMTRTCLVARGNYQQYPIISVDTFRAQVARVALSHGAEIINSVWGGAFDPELLKVVAGAQVPIVLIENQSNTTYFATHQRIGDLVSHALKNGIYRWNILIDPGVGFVERSSDNYSIIANLPELKLLGYPIVFGASRKKFLQRLLDGGYVRNNQALLPLNILVHKIAVALGADVVRVHDVLEVVQELRKAE